MEPLAMLLIAAGMDDSGERARTVSSAKAGDRAAFERLMRQHERLVLATALRLLGNLEDAQDAAQEVFLKLHRNVAKVEASGNLAGWLYRVTVNVCNDHLRRKRELIPAEEIQELASHAPDPQQILS